MQNHKIATNNDESNCEERQLVDQSKNNEQQQEISRISDSILNAINLNEYDYYNYPPKLEQAEIHRQAYYLCPDQYVLNNYPKDYCECCNKKFHRQPFNWVFGDLYEATVDEYGLAAPLYFTIIKFQLIIFIIVFCIYGIFFISEIHRICNSNPQLNCHIENNDLCRTCEFQYSYGFIDIVTIQEYLHQEKGSNYQWFQVSAFLIFLINLHLPFFYDLLITYIQFKYWNRDPYNQQNETITSIYIRGMSSKLTEKEILNLIKESMQRNNNQIISSQNKRLLQKIQIIINNSNTAHYCFCKRLLCICFLFKCSSNQVTSPIFLNYCCHFMLSNLGFIQIGLACWDCDAFFNLKRLYISFIISFFTVTLRA
ncbi:unnamed protein product [Paramecium primaurelia]|uniref:Transmembrane protein n=1 Tax=Paramecium primaurelia TaxID=5886 RepID=A0A8S1KK88_PARPR|nr:unnamed protein product [Paramecium primaurelia]